MALWEQSKWYKVGIVGGINWERKDDDGDGRPKAENEDEDGIGGGGGGGVRDVGRPKPESDGNGGGGGGGKKHFDFLAPHCENVRNSSLFYRRKTKFVFVFFVLVGGKPTESQHIQVRTN